MDFSILLILFSLIVVLLGSVIVAFGFFYSNLLNKFENAEKQNQFLRFHLQEKSLQKINAARDKSLGIIADATQQAEEILKRAEIMKSTANEQVMNELHDLSQKQKDALQSASTDLVSSFEEAVKQIQQTDKGLLSDTVKQMQEVAAGEVKSFGEKLHQETVGQEKMIDQKVEEAYKKAQDELDDYKKERLEKIDKDISLMIQAITKDIFGKSLSLENHKDLILQAIEKAKKEMVG